MEILLGTNAEYNFKLLRKDSDPSYLRVGFLNQDFLLKFHIFKFFPAFRVHITILKYFST
jgi:hypothetical protein